MSADLTPKVPGYRILQPLGRGGMASVYLAIQESVEREVALKIMAPQLSADPTFGERFLREARIAAKLHHRHVVSIFDVGVHDGIHYCAMEYLPGGPVMRRGSPPLALKPALRCVREIASALHYAQEKGFIHRDVKPDNILLREDCTCVLGDFGIARAADSGTLMTKTGSVVGTPHYMSPEQLRGRAIDGRADLYSLGVVFFQLLTGKVPYEASDSLAIGIMHMTAPLPQLPAEYRILQPILERMLAKEPGDRYQTGAEIEAALLDAEKRIASGKADTPPPRRGSDSATRPLNPIRADRKPFDPQGAVRTEPQFGRMDEVDDGGDGMRATPRPVTRTQMRRVPEPARRSGVWLFLILVVTLAGAAYWQRQAVTAWVQAQLAGDDPSETEVADQALAAGRLYSDDGKDAMAAYTAALMLDSDNQRARQGLRATLTRLYDEVAATQPRDGAQIASIVRRLTGVRGFDAERERFAGLIEDPSNTDPVPQQQQSTAPDLASAQSAETAGRLAGGNGALAHYAAAAAADTANAEARRGLDRVAGALAGQARSHLAAGNVAAAQGLQRELAAVPAVAGAAADLQREIESAAAKANRGADIERLLGEAQDLARRGRGLEPRGQSAADRYLDVLNLDANNDNARTGLNRVVAVAIAQADAALEAREIDRARKLIERIQAVAPRSADLKALNKRLKAAQDAAKAPDPEQLALRDKLIREGEIALSTEQLVDPPGDSAYDKFRGALRIDPKSESAKAGIDAVAQALRDRARAALAAGRVVSAHGDLEALASVAANDAGLSALKREVAKGYAERGQRLLDHDKVSDARNDLATAEGLDPNEPTVVQLRAALVGR